MSLPSVFQLLVICASLGVIAFALTSVTMLVARRPGKP